VSLTRDGEVLQLAIVDNGKGFQLPGTRGQGPDLRLISIDERVAIESRPGGGTRVQVRLQPPVMPALAATATRS
jgi:signal transduction histidine kinase